MNDNSYFSTRLCSTKTGKQNSLNVNVASSSGLLLSDILTVLVLATNTLCPSGDPRY